MLSLGYATGEESYPIALHTVSRGKTDAMKGDFEALGKAMAAAAAKVSNIICHELYITDENDLVMVFMTRK